MDLDLSHIDPDILANCSEVEDYNDLLKSLGISDNDVINMMCRGFYFEQEQHNEFIEILDSRIHGKGLFAKDKIETGKQWIASFKNCKYPCGRVINHSPKPNCKFVFDGDFIFCVTIKPVKIGEELLVDYRSILHKDAIESYKQSLTVLKFDSKVPSIVDWQMAAPIDKLEYELSLLPAAELPLDHIFTDGIYIRKIFAPAGTLLTSVHHNTDHPFVLVSGSLDIISNEGSCSMTGPFMGITNKGTRRAIYINTDVVFFTIHANPENIQDPDELMEKITIPINNPLIHSNDPRINTWKKDISPSRVFLTNSTTSK